MSPTHLRPTHSDEAAAGSPEDRRRLPVLDASAGASDDGGARARHLDVDASEGDEVGGDGRGAAGERSDPGSVGVEEGEGGLLQVGDLAKQCGKTVRAIHLYEELGLLRPHARSKGRYRLFASDAVLRVRWIVKLQELGLSLSTIQAVAKEWEAEPSAPFAMARMRDIFRDKLASTREQIERLRMLESELAESLRYLEACDACDPARLFAACKRCEHHEDQTPPELVAGFRAKS